METLDGSSWDVTIAGTGLQPALLALALSRSGKKILHLDSNDYYGGREAALSLSEATQWAERHHSPRSSGHFSNATITSNPDTKSSLGASRSYSLSLAPTILYTRSSLLPALVSSRAHEQLEFLAVGSWFVYQHLSPSSPSAPFQPASKLLRVPNSREDIFSDTSLSLRAKGALVKFLRFVAVYQDEEKKEVWEPYKNKSFKAFLAEHFKIQEEFHGPLLALCMSSLPDGEIKTGDALNSVYRHLTSMGVFGAGFSAVLPKYGGLSEVVQVACRAAAVGGTVYVLNKGVEAVERGEPEEGGVKLILHDGEKCTTKLLFGTRDQVPSATKRGDVAEDHSRVLRSATIVASPLQALFPPSGDGTLPPSAAVVVFPSGSLRSDGNTAGNASPVHMLVHSSDTGECPSGQCVLYSSTTASATASTSLELAMQRLLLSVQEGTAPDVLWGMSYEVSTLLSGFGLSKEGNDIYTLIDGPSDPVFDDRILDNVKEAWKIATHGRDEDFLRFGDCNAADGSIDDQNDNETT